MRGTLLNYREREVRTTQNEKVKVELLLPEPVNRAIKVICESFCQDPTEYMVESIKRGVENDIDSNFESYNDLFTNRIQRILES